MWGLARKSDYGTESMCRFWLRKTGGHYETKQLLRHRESRCIAKTVCNTVYFFTDHFLLSRVQELLKLIIKWTVIICVICTILLEAFSYTPRKITARKSALILFLNIFPREMCAKIRKGRDTPCQCAFKFYLCE